MNDLEKILQKQADERATIKVPIRAVIPRAKADGEFEIRDLLSGEVLDATEGAVRARKGVLTALPKEYVHEFLGDPKFLADAQTVEELARAVRCGGDTSKPAFTNATAMHSLLTRDELATLYAYFVKARSDLSAHPEPTQSALEQLVETCVMSPKEATEVLMRIPKHVVVELFVMLAGRLGKA